MDLDKLKFSKEIKEILNKNLSVDNFIDKVIALCKLKS